jgi:hypothetical protein
MICAKAFPCVPSAALADAVRIPLAGSVEAVDDPAATVAAMPVIPQPDAGGLVRGAGRFSEMSPLAAGKALRDSAGRAGSAILAGGAFLADADPLLGGGVCFCDLDPAFLDLSSGDLLRLGVGLAVGFLIYVLPMLWLDGYFIKRGERER